MNQAERILVTVCIIAVLEVVYMVGLHTYWPFGDAVRNLNNLDSLIHGSTFVLFPLMSWRFVNGLFDAEETK